MSAKRTKLGSSTTLPFDTFWSYLQAHPNCIVQAGTSGASLHDDDDFHWHFTSEPDGTLVVEVIRGKKLVGDVAITPSDISYVQVEPAEHDEVRFDLVNEGAQDRVVVAYFVMSHDYEGDEGTPPDRWTH